MTLSLFGPLAKSNSEVNKELLIDRFARCLVHPFPRIGLAVTALNLQGEGPLEIVTEETLREGLARTIESGLNNFRMQTTDDPITSELLLYKGIPLDTLRSSPDLIQSKGLSLKGKYLFPSVITTDGGAKATFVEAEKIAADLRNPKVALNRITDLKRSFAPICGEVNNGSTDKKNQRGTLFEAACSIVATLALEKPSAWIEQRNTGIFPDLDFRSLLEFVRLFVKFQSEGTSLWAGKPSAKKEMRRPKMHGGNYPDAPREAAFGSVGLLAALGYWAKNADGATRKQTLDVLDSIKGRPLYVVSYDNVSQTQFSHHVIELAKRGNLRDILNDFYQNARPYATVDEPFVRHDMPLVRHFYFGISRFLQQFNAASFRDFLSTRAEYPPSFDQILGVYFVEQQRIPREIVESARALGQWINLTAYFVAKEETDQSTKDYWKSIRKAKAKVLVEFESAVMSAKSPSDMLHRVSTRAGRLLQGDAPAAAQAFFDESATAEHLDFSTAQSLLIAYLRLRSAKEPKNATDAIAEPQQSQAVDSDDDLGE